MTKREKEFCRLTAVLGNPKRAAERAGFTDPGNAWTHLVAREDIAEEIHSAAKAVSRVYRDTLLCGVHRLMSADNSETLRLVLGGGLSDEELKEMNLSGVAEIKRTDKGMELKFFDRIKALEKLNFLNPGAAEGSENGLIEAMRLSAQAILESDGCGESYGGD